MPVQGTTAERQRNPTPPPPTPPVSPQSHRTADRNLGITPARTNPWQASGRNLDLEDPRPVIEQAGLNWTVSKRPLQTDDGTPIPDHMAIRRDDTRAILGVTGVDYQPVQNHQVFDFFTRVADGSPLRFETAGAFHGGRTIWALAHLPDLTFRIGEDETRSYLLLSSGHCANRPITIGPTTLRVVCMNTLRMAESRIHEARLRRPGLESGFSLRHTRNVEEALASVADAYQRTIAAHRSTVQVHEALARIPHTQALERAYFQRVFPLTAEGPDETDRARAIRRARDERLQTILASPTSRVRGTAGTALSLFHAVVEWIDHERPTRRGQDDGDLTSSRLAYAVFGSGADLKTKAWDGMLELVAA
jgi:phage/plasmid-like protein (TIGR03299 family)